MFFDFYNELEIYNIIFNLKKEDNRQDISCRSIKFTASHVLELLCRLFNICLSTSIHPDSLKIAKVTPVF